MYKYIYICVHVYTNAYIYKFLFIYTYVYAYMYVYMCAMLIYVFPHVCFVGGAWLGGYSFKSQVACRYKGKGQASHRW